MLRQSLHIAAGLAAISLASVASAGVIGGVSPTKSNGDFIAGSGIAADNFWIETAGTGEQAALKARDRNSSQPISIVGNKFFVPTGNDPNNANRTAWNFDFQFTPIAGKSASDYTYEIQADTKPAVGVATFTTVAVPGSVQAVPIGDSYYPNGTGGSISAGPTYSYNGSWSSASPSFVIANSQNYTFGHLAGSGFTNSAYAEYDINFIVRDASTNDIVVQSSIVAAVPEPTGIALLGLGAGALLLRRRSRARVA
jgi:hypothetical protein